MGLTQITTGGVDDNINIDSNTLKVDGTNNRVGIGTATPSHKLAIDSTSDADLFRIRSTAIANNTSLRFGISGSVGEIHASGGSSGTLAFKTYGSERMRIDTSGNVGIGTPSPEKRLHVHNASADCSIRIKSDTSYAQLQLIGADGLNYITSDDPVSFYVNSSERMRIDSSGRVGIGCTPSNFGTNFNALEIHSPSGTASYLALTNSTTGSNGASNGFNILTSGNDAALLLRENGFMSFSTNDTERMRIDNQGRVGLGTSSPTALLHLNATSPVLRLTGSSVGNCEIQEDGSTLMINVDSSNAKSNSALAFRTDNIERMRIDSAGVVSINQSAYNTFRLQNPTSNGANLLIQNSTTGLGAGNGLFFGLGDNEASYVWNYHNEPVIWGTNNVERMRLSNAGDVSIGTSGNQTGSKLNVYGAIGSANTRFACTEHGKGASGTYSSIVFDFAVGGSPATVIFETRAYGYNQDAVDHMFGAYSSSHNKVIRDNNSSGMSVSVTFPNSGGVTHRVTISGSITHPVAAVKATAGGLASSIDLLSITFS